MNVKKSKKRNIEAEYIHAYNALVDPSVSLRKSYRVEIVEIATGKVVAVVGRKLNAQQAERREMTAISRINEHYFVRQVEEANERP